MKTIILDGKMMISKEKAHKYIKKQLNFPEYYGENLDALWDLLTTITGDMYIEIINKEALQKNMLEYGESLIDTFLDASKENKGLNVSII